MTKKLRIVALFALLTSGVQNVIADDESVVPDLDAYWDSVSLYISTGNFEGLVSTYHPDAVLVSESIGTSYPITQALERWKPGILDTKSGKAKSNVEFRFTQRLHDATTAHEKGIFHYRTEPADGEPVEEYIHFNALLINSDGWKMVMEYQKHAATKAEWAAAE